MRAVDLAVYVASAIFEVGGLVVTVMDIRGAAKRLHEFIDHPSEVVATAMGDVTQRTVKTFGIEIDPSAVDSEQLREIREWIADTDRRLSEREASLWAFIRTNYGRVINNTYKTFMGQFRTIRGHLISSDQSSARRYPGPSLVAFGIVVGAAANIVNVLVLPAQPTP